jgi:hypothetical protein
LVPTTSNLYSFDNYSLGSSHVLSIILNIALYIPLPHVCKEEEEEEEEEYIMQFKHKNS